MGARSSQGEIDGITWQTAGIRLGTQGLDLRDPNEPGPLTELLNARFSDEQTIRQRNGHAGVLIQDGSDFAPLGDTYEVSDAWTYGHGTRVAATAAAGWENAHHPIANRGRATFMFGDTDVIWTGDRLLVAQTEGASIGSSTFWNRDSNSAALLHEGLPAFLPQQSDSTPPNVITGDYIATALSATVRVHVGANAGALNAVVINRETGALVDSSEISGSSSNDPVEPVVFQSGAYMVVVWRDSAGKTLYYNAWTGAAWIGANVIHSDVWAYDVVPVPGGFHLLWREHTDPKLHVGKYAGITSQNSPYPFDATVDPAAGSAGTANGPVALAVSPAGDLAVLCETTTGLWARVYTPSMGIPTGGIWTQISGATGWSGGLAICSRGLKDSNSRYRYVIHASRADSSGVIVRSMLLDGTLDTAATTRYNSRLASKSFLVGDEVFCWLRANNAGTHYLIGGVHSPQVCGYADREEAIARTLADGNYGIPLVLPDPADDTGMLFTWARPYNTGQTYEHGGDVRIGDLNFLPSMLPVQFGRSVYLPGSAVRNYDGLILGDAGFQDYPSITQHTPANGGGMLTSGDYYFRVYAVRYNMVGERFQSAAVTYGPVTLTGSQGQVTLTIATLPDTNHSDVQFEVYRTEAGGTTFYLDGVVANDLASGTVSYTSDRVDRSTPLVSTDLIRQLADSKAPGVDAQPELEEWGPLGCSMLAVSGDRLWGAGGQVPPGIVQFSKLHEDGEGAGFDDLAGFQEIDTEGHPVTSLFRLNDVTVAGQKDKLFIIAGIGPDNFGRGAFQIPQIALADGPTTHAGTRLMQLGAVYWGSEGPRLITTGYQVEDISAPVRKLAAGLVPTGCRVSLSKQEVIWYTEGGDALLWNYRGGNSRWARWSGLHVAGCSDAALITTAGTLLKEDDNAAGDAGQSFAFRFKTGRLRPEQIIAGHTLVNYVGLLGMFEGPHKARVRVFYNGAPMWNDEWTWEPDDKTWLTLVDDVADLTPAQVDALNPVDRSGQYMTHKRIKRNDCAFLQVEVSNIESDGPTFTPTELTLELGARGGLARVAVNTFGG